MDQGDGKAGYGVATLGDVGFRNIAVRHLGPKGSIHHSKSLHQFKGYCVYITNPQDCLQGKGNVKFRDKKRDRERETHKI